MMSKTNGDFMKKELVRSFKEGKPTQEKELRLREYIEFQLEDRRNRFIELLMLILIFVGFGLCILIVFFIIQYSPQNETTEILKICQTITHIKGVTP